MIGVAAAMPRRGVLKLAGMAGLFSMGGSITIRAATAGDESGAGQVTASFLTRICQIVLPATGTPGAAEAGVSRFLPLAFDHGLFGGDKTTLAQLAGALDKRVAGGRFDQASHKAQEAALSTLDKETFAHPKAQVSQTSAAANAQQPGAPLTEFDIWRKVKDAIVCSYYTTEAGGSQELVFQLIAGSDYQADVDVTKIKYMSNFWIENVF